MGANDKKIENLDYDKLMIKIYLNREKILNELNKKDGEPSLEKIEKWRLEITKIEAELIEADIKYENEISKSLKELYGKNSEINFSHSQIGDEGKKEESFLEQRNNFINYLKVDYKSVVINSEKVDKEVGEKEKNVEKESDIDKER